VTGKFYHIYLINQLKVRVKPSKISFCPQTVSTGLLPIWVTHRITDNFLTTFQDENCSDIQMVFDTPGALSISRYSENIAKVIAFF
jgi:hypothetical protein